MYIRVSEIPGGGLDLFASRGKASIPRVLEGMDPAPLRELKLVGADLLLTVEKGDLWIEGSFEAQGEGFCDRCSEPVTLRFGKAFHFPTPEKPGRASAGSAIFMRKTSMSDSMTERCRTNDIMWSIWPRVP